MNRRRTGAWRGIPARAAAFSAQTAAVIAALVQQGTRRSMRACTAIVRPIMLSAAAPHACSATTIDASSGQAAASATSAPRHSIEVNDSSRSAASLLALTQAGLRSIVMTRPRLSETSSTSFAASSPTYDLPAAASTSTMGDLRENRQIPRPISSRRAATSRALRRSSLRSRAPSAAM